MGKDKPIKLKEGTTLEELMKAATKGNPQPKKKQAKKKGRKS